MFDVFCLLEKYGSPLYAYDYHILKDRCDAIRKFSDDIKRGLPDRIAVSMHYSTKANYYFWKRNKIRHF